MTIKERIAEARGLCRDIESDLEQVEILRGVGNPVASSDYLLNSNHLLTELREHVLTLLEHYGRQCLKKAKR